MTNQNITVMTSSHNMDWATPQEFVDSLPYKFELDLCATHNNAKCSQWISPAKDSLTISWERRGICFLNPPYGRSIGHWVEKASKEARNGTTIVMLVPNRTETKWFYYIWRYAKLICFCSKRIKFKRSPNDNDSAPFASVIAVFSEYDQPNMKFKAMSKLGVVIQPIKNTLWLPKHMEALHGTVHEDLEPPKKADKNKFRKHKK